MKKIIFDIETNGSNAMENRITCISYKVIGEDKIETLINEDETLILKAFIEKCEDNVEELQLIGFNTDSFDIPFFVKRCIIHNIPIMKGFKSVDLRKVANSFFFSYNAREKGGLNDWAKLLGFEVKETNGLEVVKAWEKGDIELIMKHCEFDIGLTEALYLRLKNVRLV